MKGQASSTGYIAPEDDANDIARRIAEDNEAVMSQPGQVCGEVDAVRKIRVTVTVEDE